MEKARACFFFLLNLCISTVVFYIYICVNLLSIYMYILNIGSWCSLIKVIKAGESILFANTGKL